MYKACFGVSVVLAVLGLALLGVGINFAIISQLPHTLYRGSTNSITTIHFTEERTLQENERYQYSYEHHYDKTEGITEIPVATVCFEYLICPDGDYCSFVVQMQHIQVEQNTYLFRH
jgi:hypothetical protein